MGVEENEERAAKLAGPAIQRTLEDLAKKWQVSYQAGERVEAPIGTLRGGGGIGRLGDRKETKAGPRLEMWGWVPGPRKA